MRPISLYDFYDMFAGARSFAVVGNAGTILTHDNGALIDGCDIVVRFNCAYTAGIEAKVGRRTDILCANIGKSLDECASPATTLGPRCVVTFATKSPRDGSCDPGRFAEWVGDLPCLITWAPDLVGVAQGTRTRQLTQGSYLLYTLLRMFKIERLLVTGFTMYRPTAGAPLKYYGRNRRKLGLAHDLDEEARVLAAMLGGFEGELVATPEVEDLLEREGRRVRTAGRGLLGLGAARGKVSAADRLRGWAAWRLIETGVKLRRTLEARSALDIGRFETEKKRRKAGAA